MTAPSNTTTTLVSVGNREDLVNTIYRVAPEETPFISQIGTDDSATAVTHEWQTETLASPDATAQALEGDDASLVAPNLTSRLGNLCQINRKDYGVSGTQSAVKSAGRANDLARQRILHGIEARRDAEKRFIGNFGTVTESGGTARKSGGALAAITSNTSKGAGGTETAISGSTWTAAGNGTTRAFTEALLKTVLASAFNNGATPKVAYMGATHKQQASAFTGIASNRKDVPGNKPATIIGAADVYVSDFGNISFVPHAYGLSRDCLLIDPDFWTVAVLRGWKTSPLAKTGDTEKEMILAEHTLVARNERSSAAIRDLA